MSLEQDLLSLKNKAEKLNTVKIETATKLQGLETDKDKLLAECAELGMNPKEIEETVKNLEIKLQTEINSLSEKIDGVLSELNRL